MTETCPTKFWNVQYCKHLSINVQTNDAMLSSDEQNYVPLLFRKCTSCMMHVIRVRLLQSSRRIQCHDQEYLKSIAAIKPPI
jgi:hypothetical protein